MKNYIKPAIAVEKIVSSENVALDYGNTTTYADTENGIVTVFEIASFQTNSTI